MHPNAELISTFYRAFAEKDHTTMSESYAEGATFADPVFVHLKTDETRAMWRMFCTSGNEVSVTFSDVQADDKHGSAKWEAVYKFPPTKRPVHNKVSASFDFADGRIVKHDDNFDLYRWTRMALGPLGITLGWTPMVQGQVRKKAAAQLQRFMAEEAKGSE